MRELRNRIEMLLQEYRDEAANEERFVSEVLTVLAMGSVARARMIAEMAQIVARHSTSLRSPAEEREFQDRIQVFMPNDYDAVYRQ
jgi:hypothetical protein